ncbi:MAG TPA: elongation factor 1-beta [Thermoplasmata archaeon]|nr:elongation factor 1-beta [Thermoplasmata archaeon]
MSKVAVTFRVMPEGVEVDLDAVQSQLRDSLRERLKKLEVKPVAYGLRAVEAIVILEDAAGEMERVESLLLQIPGVGGVETTEVTLL